MVFFVFFFFFIFLRIEVTETFEIIHISFEEIDTEESASSFSKVSSLDDDLDRIYLESGSSDEEMVGEEIDSNIWNEMKSKSAQSS